MQALKKALEYGGTPGGKALLQKLGWLGAGVAAGGTGKEVIGLVRDEVSGANPLKRAVLTELQDLSQDPDLMMKRLEQGTNIAANLRRFAGGGQDRR